MSNEVKKRNFGLRIVDCGMGTGEKKLLIADRELRIGKYREIGSDCRFRIAD